MLALLVSSAAVGQTELEKKEAELTRAKAQQDSMKQVVKGLEAQVKALKPPVYWKKGGFTALNFNSVGLNNWAAGGIQANSVTALGNAFANYNKNKVSWINNLDLAYGIIKQEGEEYRKNEDKIDFLTKFGYKATNKLNYAFLGNFKSQFAPGYDFSDPDENRPVISRFLAPAFINASLGIDYKVFEWLSIYFSPAAGKLTLVTDDSIAAQHIYIPDSKDEQGVQFYNDNFRAEFGAFVNVLLQYDFTDNLGIRSRVDLFTNYTDKNVANRGNVDVNWETMLNMKITKFIGASLFTHLIYDDDIDIPTTFDSDGNALTYGPRAQFKRVFGIGFSYKF